MPTLTILLPTYNGAAFLSEQIASIRAQSFADWQLLTCDDGSTDATVPLMRALADADPRIVVLPSSGNLGQKRRLRDLATAADSPLIAVSDQDDVWAPDKLARLLDALGSADLVFGSSWLIDADGRELGRQLADDLPPPFVAGERLSLLFRPIVSAHATIARRGLFRGASFDRDGAFDWLLSLEAAFGQGVAFAPDARTLHRMHGGNQANGRHIARAEPPRLVSRYDVTHVRGWVIVARTQLLTALDHLARSQWIAPEARARLQAAHALCHDAWIARPQAMPWRDLVARLRDQLRPLAGYPGDWAYAHGKLLQLSHPPYSLARFRARAARLRRERQWFA